MHLLLQNEYRLDLQGGALFIATGISADGRAIAGNGTRPDGFWGCHLGGADAAWDGGRLLGRGVIRCDGEGGLQAGDGVVVLVEDLDSI